MTTGKHSESTGKIWYIYVLSLENARVYIGIATDVSRRFQQHCAGKGARYTARNRPIEILLSKRLGRMTMREAELYEDALTYEICMKLGKKFCQGGHLVGKATLKGLRYNDIPRRYKDKFPLNFLRGAKEAVKAEKYRRKQQGIYWNTKRYQFARNIQPAPDIVVPEARKLTEQEKSDILHNLEKVAARARAKREAERQEWQETVDQEIIDNLRNFL